MRVEIKLSISVKPNVRNKSIMSFLGFMAKNKDEINDICYAEENVLRYMIINFANLKFTLLAILQ